MFAEVVVNTPLYRQGRPGAGVADGQRPGTPAHDLTFHYSIPEDLENRIQPGHLVWVPFGPRRLQGIVLAVMESAPVAETRDVDALADPRPRLNPAQIALARWISQTYLAPLIDCIRLMLPGELDRQAATVELSPSAAFSAEGEGGIGIDLAGLTADQRAVVELVRHGGRLRLAQIERALGRPGWRRAVNGLVRRGILVRRDVVTRPGVRPMIAELVRLVASPVAVVDLPIGRANKQADALAWLARTEDPAPALSEVCRGAGCGEQHVRALAERGLARLTERQTLVAAALAPDEIDRAVSAELKRAPKQAAVLSALKGRGKALGSPVPLDALLARTGAAPDAVRQLEARGYVRRLEQEPAVILTLPRDEVEPWLLRLRGLEVPARVLEFLEREGGPVEVGVVYAETGATPDLLRTLAGARLIAVEKREVWRDPLAGRVFVTDVPPTLTPAQAAALEKIRSAPHPRPPRDIAAAEVAEVEVEQENIPTVSAAQSAFLLHGVTGSGKTEIYLRAIESVLQEGRQAIALVPEISLTPQTIRRFAARFPGQVTVWHSQLTAGERHDVWRRVRDGKIGVVVGARSAVFAPVPRLGLIVVDEEHEPSYKQEVTPRYHAREVALELGRLTGATVILGSATPDVTTYFRAERGELKLVELPERIANPEVGDWRLDVGGDVPSTSKVRPPSSNLQPLTSIIQLPPVQIVDMRAELKGGNRSIFSRALQQALAETLATHEQAILFLNRRGTATFVQCRDCGYVLTCPRCSTRLTYHHQAQALLCHHCGLRPEAPDRCPRCGSRRIRYFGLGTEQVEETVLQMFPQARTLRWDRDTTGGRLAHELLLEQFIRGQANVLVGTQMIAKGLDLPRVTLVGVVSADTALNLPDFRAGERTFQLLTQVAGRAGRSARGGQVIVQTYTPDNYAIQAASRHDYAAFYRQEIAFRREQGYPPFGRLVELLYASPSRARAQAEAETLAAELRDRAARLGISNLDVIGPAPAFLVRLRGRYRWQIILRGRDPHALLRDLPLPAGWRVDVDPM